MEANKSIEQRIEELESLVYASKNVLSFDEASKFLSLSKSYLYKLTSAGLIPHYKPQGKMIYFEILLSAKNQMNIKNLPQCR